MNSWYYESACSPRSQSISTSCLATDPYLPKVFSLGFLVSRCWNRVLICLTRNTNPNDRREKQGIWLIWLRCKDFCEALDPQMHVVVTWHKPCLPNPLPEQVPMPTMFVAFRSQITLLLMPVRGFSTISSSPAVSYFNMTSQCAEGRSRCFREEWDIGYDRKYILCDGVLDANCSQFVLQVVPQIHQRFYWQCLE